MKRSSAFLFFLCGMLAPVCASSTPLRQRIGGISVPFIANQGQTDRAVAFYAQTFAGAIFVTHKGEIVHFLQGTSGWTLTETLVGGKPRPAGEEPAETQVSYFLGNDPARWRSALPTYRSVSLGEVWKGIKVSLRAHGNNIEKIFTVAPGASVKAIRLKIDGTEGLRVDKTRALVAKTGLGDVSFSPPIAYQEKGAKRLPVAAACLLVKGGEYGFGLGTYDPALPVVIDPLLQATYLGGTQAESAAAIAIHPTNGEVFVAGRTLSANFPGTAGGAQAAVSIIPDAFVARLNTSLTALAQATYLGGSGSDVATALGIHPSSGELYVAGSTSSLDFPGTLGGFQILLAGPVDAFVVRLGGDLTTLKQATYLGGSSGDGARAIAIHPSNGEMYVTGNTTSADLPGTAGGAQVAYGGAVDAFVARLNANLTALIQATYLGGSRADDAFAFTLDPLSAEPYVAGFTSSPDLPGTAGSAQALFGGLTDAFVARLDESLTTLGRATYLGGSGADDALAIAVDAARQELYVTGLTTSADFPRTAGGAQPAMSGGPSGFVARLDGGLRRLGQATYIGGNGGDEAFALAIHPASGEIYVAGETQSTNFPGTGGGFQALYGGFADAFLARLTANLRSIVQGTYLGGRSGDGARALAIHPANGEIYVAGATGSSNFPGTRGGAQPSQAGFGDAFIARLTPDLAAAGPAEPIPTLSEWGLLVLSVLLALSGILYLRGRNAG